MKKRRIIWKDTKAQKAYLNRNRHGERQLGPDGLRRLIDMISQIRNRPIAELRRDRPYRFKRLGGRRSGKYSMRYNDRKRLEFRFDGTDDDGCDVYILHLRDHYGSK